MRFGKRRQEVEVPGVPGVKISTAGAKRPKRRMSAGGSAAPAAAAAEPVTPEVPAPSPAESIAPEAPAAYDEPVADEEPAVEGEAVELPATEPAAPVHEPPLPPSGRRAAATPDPMPFPVADEPVAVVTPGSGATAPVMPLGESGAAFASGHAAAPGASWQEPLMELADERPELVVAAAFAGGILAAMILRRLGN